MRDWLLTIIRPPLYRALSLGKRLWVACGQPMASAVRSIRHGGLLGRLAPAYLRYNEQSKRYPTLQADIAVVIPCHNYAHFLPECLESVLAQTLQPSDILVVDDASEDNTKEVVERYAERGVRYLRVEHRDPSCTRNSGAEATDSTFVMFLDADDAIPPTHLKQCLAGMKNERTAITYGNVRCIGRKKMQPRTAPEYDRFHLLQGNFISSNALLRRQAFNLVGGYRPLRNAHEDWDLYLRITANHWQAKRVDTLTRYRVHNESFLQTTLQRTQSYFYFAALDQRPITIFTSLTGNTHALEQLAINLEHLAYDKQYLTIHWHDQSNDDTFQANARSRLADIPCAHSMYTTATMQTVDTESSRLSAWHSLQQHCTTDFVLCWSDNTTMEPTTLTTLLQHVEPYVVAVIADANAPYNCILCQTLALQKVHAGSAMMFDELSQYGGVVHAHDVAVEPVKAVDTAHLCYSGTL